MHLLPSVIIRKVAKEFKKNHPYISYEVEDLVQEGHLILPEVKSAFNKDRGTKFSTFLWYRIEFHFKFITKEEKRLIILDPIEVPEVAYEPAQFPPKFIGRLSNNAKRYLATVLDFPTDLKLFLERDKTMAGKSAKREAFKYRVGQFLGFSKKEVNRIQDEVKEKLIQ